MTIEKVLKELGISAVVNVSDVSSAKSQSADIVVIFLAQKKNLF